ncbi:MAG: hypothetical protein O3A00_18365, partial [Planctomycetota bacterium]|nr:hypothetical protein [Planctomycetota bacterium]
CPSYTQKRKIHKFRGREQDQPAVWFLPLKEPISPHVEKLLGPSKLGLESSLQAVDPDGAG